MTFVCTCVLFELLSLFIRYLVCQGLQEERPKAIIEYLFSVNKKFHEIKSDGTENELDVMEIVDFDEISSDNEFMEYLNNSHTR